MAVLSSLDFVYMPSRDTARDLAFYVDSLGGKVVFAIEAFGARVAEVRLGHEVDLGTGGARLVLADHLEGDAPVLVHRVRDLDTAVDALERRGVAITRFGIPHGPCAELETPGGQRIAMYELTRPEVDEHFAGRRDFEPAR